MIKIGIDLSINFSACVVCDTDINEFMYYGITNKIPPKWVKYKDKPSNIIVSMYDKKIVDKNISYEERERIKTYNLLQILNRIQIILHHHRPVEVLIEGISFSSSNTTSIIELAGLNFLVRMLCERMGIKFTIVSPTSLKKFATGNGQSDKQMMIESLCILQPMFQCLNNVLKIDDMADAYFLSQYIPMK